MSMRYPGGLIASSPVNAAYPSGVWTQAQTQPYAAQNVWMRDQFWPNTTLLLQGNGTNGAQNNTFLDSSTNNFTITRNGNTTQGSFTPYEANGYWSNYFDGSGDWLSVPDNNALDLSGDFTIEFWLNVDSGNLDRSGVVGKRSQSTWNTDLDWVIRVETSAGKIGFGYDAAGNYYDMGSYVVGEWAYYAITRSGTSIRTFKNGVQIATATDSRTYTTTELLRIGINGPGLEYKGYISNMRIVKGTAVYTSAFTPSTTPLTAITNTSLLTCQSNRFVDNSTNNFTISIGGGTPSVQAFQPFPGATTWSGSVLGGSGYFDGTGDYLNGSSSTGATNFGTGDFTTECWVYFTTVASQSNFIDNLGNSTYTLYIAPGGQLRFFNGADRIIGATLTAGQWYHIALVRSSGVTRLWLNGAQTGGNYTDGNNYAGGSTFPFIGAAFNASTFHTGYMADVRCVKSAVYTSAFTPPSAPLTAIANTSLLLNFTNAGIFDSAMMNNLETVGNAQVSTSVVKYGTGSISLDGTGDWLIGPASLNLVANGDFTVEAWVYMNANSGSHTIINYSNASGQTQWGLFVGLITSGKASFYWVNTSPTGFNATGTTTIPTGQWVHIAGTLQGTTLRVFVNGVLEGTGTTSGSARSQSSPLLFVGQSGVGAETLNGYIDDLRITKGAARYIGNFTPPVARMPGQ